MFDGREAKSWLGSWGVVWKYRPCLRYQFVSRVRSWFPLGDCQPLPYFNYIGEVLPAMIILSSASAFSIHPKVLSNPCMLPVLVMSPACISTSHFGSGVRNTLDVGSGTTLCVSDTRNIRTLAVVIAADIKPKSDLL